MNEAGLIDTHVHMWRVELARQTWMTDALDYIARDFGPPEFREATAGTGVTRAVVIEAGQTPAENQALAETAASSDLVAGIAPWVDITSPSLAGELDRWQQHPKFVGIRMGFQGDEDPDAVTRPKVMDGLREIARRGLVFEFLVDTAQLAGVLTAHEQVPDLRSVVEHLAKPDMIGGSDDDVWYQAMGRIAAETAAVGKLSLSPLPAAIETAAKNPGQGWNIDAVRPYVQFMLERFGARRLMWGSDWPIALVTTDYVSTLDAMRQAIGAVTEPDERRIFGETAVEVYRLA